MNLPLRALIFVFWALPVIADSLEFREFTLKQIEGADALTPAQIKAEIRAAHLGLDRSVTVGIADGEIKFSNAETVTFPTELHADLTVEGVGDVEVGLVIVGSVEESGRWLELAFDYRNVTKLPDVVQKVGGGGLVEMPAFRVRRCSSEVMIDSEADEWFVFPMSQDAGERSYVEVKFTKE